MVDEPFGRQPLPVIVTITGEDQIDVDEWYRDLSRRAEYKGDMVQEGPTTQTSRSFKIYPRAVND